MNEYLLTYLSTSNWARNFYQQLLGNVDPSQGIAGRSNVLLDENISSAVQWNQSTRDILAGVGGLYQEYNLVYRTLYNLDTQLKAETSRLEGAVRAYEAIERRLKNWSPFKYTPSARMDIDLTTEKWLDYTPDYYTRSTTLSVLNYEQALQLPSAGTFSAIRSQGGFVGTVKLEKILGQVINEADPSLAFDGESTTEWIASAKTPTPIRIDTNTVSWLSSRYQQGAAARLRINLERPILVSEIYIDPLTSDPMTLDSIAWRPLDSPNLLANPNFSEEDFSDPTLPYLWTASSSSATISGGAGLDGSNAACLLNSSTISQTLTLADKGMLDLHWIQKGSYGLQAGCTITWLLPTASALSVIQEVFPLSLTWQNCAVSVSIPNTATSAIVSFGLQDANDQAVVWLDNCFVGENSTETVFLFTEEESRMNRPKTLALASPVFSDTFWITFVQTHARLGMWPLVANSRRVSPLLRDLNPAWQMAYKNRGVSSHSNSQMYEYEFGAKEIDLRYNEYLATGRAVTIPFITANEIREIWIESIQSSDKGITYSVALESQPPQEAPEVSELIPITQLNNTSSIARRIKIYTQEEIDAGWKTISNDISEPIVTRIIPPVRKRWTSPNGTDRFGKLAMPDICHIRMPQVVAIQSFLASSYPTPIDFDPNASKVLGMTMPSTTISLAGYYNTINTTMTNRSDLERSLPSGITEQPITIQREGYVPIKVWVETNQWQAVPDTFGIPEKGRVRFVRFEALDSKPLTHRKTSTSDRNLFDLAPTPGGIPAGTEWRQTPRNLFNEERALRKSADAALLLSVKIKTPDGKSKTVSRADWEAYVKGCRTGTRQEWITERGVDTYQTKYYPLVDGSQGNLTGKDAGGRTLLRLWWYQATPDPIVYPISNEHYRVTDPSLGLVEIIMTPPNTGCVLVADYWHASQQNSQEPYSWSLALTLPISGYTLDDGNKQFPLTARSYPVTRNMTDYIYGRIPTLKPPSFDPMQDDYHPVIEYYLNGNNELVFAREFFQYGDVQARITVEYESLQIAPRLFVDMSRSEGRSTNTPRIESLSLCARERKSMLRIGSS